MVIPESGMEDGNVRIVTRLFENKHFVILKYSSDLIKAKDVFNRINYRYNLGETWFISVGDEVYSLSFRLFNWINYRNMLFEFGIDRRFREQCLKGRCGFLLVKKPVLFHFKTTCNSRMNAMNETLKSNLCRLIFNKEVI